jgi:mannosyltransferase OCH1-like enzyme
MIRLYLYLWFFLILFIIVFFKVNKIKKKVIQYTIPDKIWTYWHDKNIPEHVLKCIETWRKFNPSYEIIILNNDNYTNYIKNCNILDYPSARFYQRVSDFMRMHVINQHGGIWLDASIILNENLDWVKKQYKKNNYDFIGFYIEGTGTKKEYPIIEN